MLIKAPPLSNAERQTMFRASHPGYNRRYRFSMKAHRRKQLEAAAVAETAAPAAAPGPVATQQAEIPPVAWMAA